MKIKLKYIRSIHTFLKYSHHCDGEIVAKHNGHKINTNSALKMYSLSLPVELDVTIDKCNDEVKSDFYDFISKWKVEE